MWTWEFFEDAKTSGKKSASWWFLCFSDSLGSQDDRDGFGWENVELLDHGMSWAMGVLTWDGPKLMAISYLELRVPETVNCFPTFLQIQLVVDINWYASKSEHMLKKHFSRFAPSIFRASWKKCPHFHPFPQQPRPPSRCIVANKCTASVHIIAAPQDDMARWYATLSGMRSRPGCVTKTCPMMVFLGWHTKN